MTHINVEQLVTKPNQTKLLHSNEFKSPGLKQNKVIVTERHLTMDVGEKQVHHVGDVGGSGHVDGRLPAGVGVFQVGPRR